MYSQISHMVKFKELRYHKMFRIIWPWLLLVRKKILKVCLQIFLNFGRENLVVQFGVWGSINFIFCYSYCSANRPLIICFYLNTFKFLMLSFSIGYLWCSGKVCCGSKVIGLKGNGLHMLI